MEQRNYQQATKNEKYVGDVLLQKTFVQDLLSGKRLKSNGELGKFPILERHPPIISRELFEKINGVLFLGGDKNALNFIDGYLRSALNIKI